MTVDQGTSPCETCECERNPNNNCTIKESKPPLLLKPVAATCNMEEPLQEKGAGNFVQNHMLMPINKTSATSCHMKDYLELVELSAHLDFH